MGRRLGRLSPGIAGSRGALSGPDHDGSISGLSAGQAQDHPQTDKEHNRSGVPRQEEDELLLYRENENYRPETDQLLFHLPLAGSAFRKVYYDVGYNRPTA